MDWEQDSEESRPIFAALAASAKRSWFKALILWLFVAWGAGIFFGETNYSESTSAYYGLGTLQTYKDVDVSKSSGIAVWDAGVVQFKEGTHIESSIGGSFKNADIFCVAPLKLGDEEP